MRISKTPEQVRAEATAAAAEELQQVLKVIETAGASALVAGPSGCASLISTAAHLYEKHTSLIEADALEFTGGVSTLVPSALGGFIGPSGVDYLGIAMDAERDARRRRAAAQYPEPEPEPPPIDRDPTPICLLCAKPLGEHDYNACPISPPK